MHRSLNPSHLFLSLLLFSIVRGGTVFDVTNYGARGDGATDSTAAFLNAWNAACTSTAPAVMNVPTGFYLIKNVLFRGPCRSFVTVRILGTLVAPADYGEIVKLSYWIMFKRIDGLSIDGGTLDARGKSYWDCKTSNGLCPSSGPTSLTLGSVRNGKISGLTSMNSLQIHIAIYGCTNTSLTGLKISAPGDSPNTDGIHVEASTGTWISSCTIGTGDDCISIGPGAVTTDISGIECGPGHGISIGSLGRNADEAGVQDVRVSNTNFTGTTNGVRIKSWARPSNGFVNTVLYEKLRMKNVQNPIVIDQKYCPNNINCPTQSSGIKIDDVRYKNIEGSSATRVAITHRCSSSNPCTNLLLADVNLSYSGPGTAASYCENVQGTAFGTVSPTSCF